MLHFEKLDNEHTRRIDCPGTEKHYLVRTGRDDTIGNHCVMIEPFLPMSERIKRMTVYEDDIWVITFPKCGTTWTQEMVWLLNNDLNYERAASQTLEERFPFLELSGALTLIAGDSVGRVERLQRPRHIKSHLPVQLLPDQLWTVKPKVVYVSRNPKDACTSFYHHYRNIVGYDGPKEHFYDAFLHDSLIYAPFGDHVRAFWELQKHHEHIYFLTYERMKRNLVAVIEGVSKFLGKYYDQQRITVLTQHLSVDSMRANKSCNMEELLEWARKTNYSEERKNLQNNQFRFIRSGAIGSYKADMSEKYVELFEDYERTITKGSDFDFFS